MIEDQVKEYVAADFFDNVPDASFLVGLVEEVLSAQAILRQVTDELIDMVDALDDRERRKTVRHIYWNELRVPKDSKLGGWLNRRLRDAAVNVGLQCLINNCTNVVATSVTQASDLKRFVMCDECEARERAQFFDKMRASRDDAAEAKAMSEAERIANLRLLPYGEYLRTEHWRDVRTRALAFASRRCQLCNASSSLEVHHRHYRSIGAESINDVLVLCRSCHAKHHDTQP